MPDLLASTSISGSVSVSDLATRATNTRWRAVDTLGKVKNDR